MGWPVVRAVRVRDVAVSLLASLFVLSALATVVAAQGGAPAPESRVELEDKPGDVMLNAGTRAGVPPQSASSSPINTDHLDLLGVMFGEETDTEFKVQLKLKALNAQQTPFPVGFAFRAVTFRY